MFNLFGGFLIPKPKILNWWIWMYYLTPTSWSLNALLASQYKTKSVEAFIRDYFGYRHDELAPVFVLLALYPIILALCLHFVYQNSTSREGRQIFALLATSVSSLFI
ncbi:hypothetical protein QVD17_00237 [Tagetes erecta]|uniref:ABC-2 type transporter transmembrane domain-containing protein n=1 Tax=Tagetes erecta TaxID=13708 RepID=A0AAD8P6U0_TARER|nr:hypothetical protein QVD17_00237 [Tagetes erecta]